MNYLPKSLAVGFVLATFAASSVLAAGTHPVTGEALADDQTFTYSLLDEFTTADPQMVEDVSGSYFVRDLFEGLMNQDADGNLIPGVATGYTTNGAKMSIHLHFEIMRDGLTVIQLPPMTLFMRGVA